MIKRRIIKIDEKLCNGCGLCASACHEGAIGLIHGIATLLRDDYCDGLGDCLPVCPTNAISFEEREALAYDEEAVKLNMTKAHANHDCSGGTIHLNKSFGSGCPSSEEKQFHRTESTMTIKPTISQLKQWPVQLMLASPNAAYFNDSKLLIAADCTAYAYANFHNDFMKNHITLIGCPKQDQGNYERRLSAIISENNIKSVTVIRMEVPCCGGIENVTINALKNSGKMIPWQVITITTDGQILED